MALTKVTSGGISDIAAAVEGASDSNKFTDADHSKLNAIEASATADQTNAEIKAAVEAATDSNTFTDADHSKLDGVAASANNYVHPNHSGDVVSAADGAMTIQTDAVDIAMLSATGTPGSTTFLRGDNAWATAGSTSASDLTSGTLPDARFPSALPAISGANLTNLTSTFNGLTDTTVSTSAPATNSNPSATGHLWVNKNSGESYVCTDATTNANVWFNIGDGADTYGADILIVAGGGGGGTNGGEGGGGGAGGMLEYTGTQLTPTTTYTVTVGAAGPGATNYADRTGNGGDSSVTGLTTAVGGGLGGNYPGATAGGDGNNGGSGGGGGGNYSGADNGHAGGTGTSGQGNNGADGLSATLYLGGGGGGKGAAGSQGSGSTGGNGGVGAANSITGSSVYYAGGGGGNSNGGPDGSGGNGGGGDNGSHGTTNTGGGGGAKAMNGGSGVVIMRVLTSNYSGTTSGSPTVSTSGSHTVLKFTGSGSYTA